MLLMLFAVIPAIARDFTYTFEGQTLTYTVIDENAKTCMPKEGYTDSNWNAFPGNNVSGELILPEHPIDNQMEYTLTSIGFRAFSGCNGLTLIKIPNTVTSIGEDAFAGSSDLTSVVIPNSVISIGNRAFTGCKGMTSVDIGNSVKSIGKSAFYWCIGLTSVIIPNSVESIGCDAFSGCSGLTSVVIGNSVLIIDEYAFYNCRGLTSIEIPNSVISIGEGAFWNCKGLASVVIGNSLTSIENYVFKGCENIQTIYSANRVPPTCKSNTFDEVPTDAIVYVPVGSIPGYSTSEGWSRFFKFVETDNFPNAVESIASDIDSSINDIYTLQGVCVKRNATQTDVDALTPGLYIIAGKKVIIK